MRVKISSSPPLLPVRAWFPLPLPSVQSTPTISSFKSNLCTSLPAFRGVSPSSLRLSIDGFELLDNSELTVVRDGDLICVDILDVPTQDATARDRVGQDASHATYKRMEPAASRKRKQRVSTPSPSTSESEAKSTTSSSASESKSESESDTSDTESTSDSDDSSRPTAPSLQKTEPSRIHAREQAQVTPLVQPKAHVVDPSTFVPPGYGKPQTRARNLRRRLKRTHERDATGGPVSGANAVMAGNDAQVEGITPDSSRDAHSGLLSLSLRNKNKAKNFKSLIGRPLAPKIIFGDQEGDASASTSGAMATPVEVLPKPQAASTRALPRLIPPSSRSSLPPNLFVTSIDVEAGSHRGKKKRKMRNAYGDELEGQSVGGENGDVWLDYGDDVDKMTGPAPESEVDVERLEAIADKQWASLARLTSEEQVTRGMIVGYKVLGINPVTCTPEHCVTVGRVVSCDSKGVIVRPLRVREQVSFSGPVEGEEGEEEEAAEWGEIASGDWRLVQ